MLYYVPIQLVRGVGNYFLCKMIRRASVADAPRVLELLKMGLLRMRTDGNYNQWQEDTHSLATVLKDIALEQCYVVEIDGVLVSTFVMLRTPDPSYAYIEGKWLSEREYVTLHRMASDGTQRGIAHVVFDWARGFGFDLRADTHQDNHRMQHILESYGFVYCGTIYIANVGARRAYVYVNK